jgi:hypothetical protein
LQKPLSIKLKKIYPLSLCEIRVLKVERNEWACETLSLCEIRILKVEKN